MSRTKAQRGPLLSSLVMVALATVATGLLAFIGFQTGLVDSVIPSSSSGGDHQSRRVRVSDGPTATPGVQTAPASAPAATAVPTTGPVAPTFSSSPDQGRGGERPGATSAPKPVRTTTATTKATTAPTKKPTASATPTKSPSPTSTSTTQAPTPAPTCGTGRKPRCPSSGPPQAPNAQSSPTSASFSSYSAPTASSEPSEPVQDKSTRKPAKAKGRSSAHGSRGRNR